MKPKMFICVMVALTCVPFISSEQIHNAVETEMFSIPISPNLFNWTYQEFDQQYRFHASLLGKPELPSWLRYIYSGRHHSGFIFGTPPKPTKEPITLEVIGLNRQDFETRRLLLTLIVHPKENLSKHEVELKIDNLNVEDLLDEHRMSSLKHILRTKLWLESNQDLYTTFLASAIDLGARWPLKPSDGEGLVVRLGSSMPLSAELKRLREEVRPLSRRAHCPRDYKRTTVERLFRDHGFALDWCNFQLYNTLHSDSGTELLEYLSPPPSPAPVPPPAPARPPAPERCRLPARGYELALLVAAAAPLALAALAAAALAAVICAPASVAHKSSKVELCRYGTGNTEQTQVADNTSNKSIGISPNNSLARPYSPKSTNLAGNYNRPQPPPYMGSATNSLHQPRSTASPSTSNHTPEHRTALEESLKLLNEANISANLSTNISAYDSAMKEPIIDMVDGVDDYVPIKSDYKDLDDINVPDLAKFGIGEICHEVIGEPPVKTWFC